MRHAACVLPALAVCLRYADEVMPVKDKDLQMLFSKPYDAALRDALRELVGLGDLGRTVEDALHGDPHAAGMYIGRYRELTQTLLGAAARARPEILIIDSLDEVQLRVPSGGQVGWLPAALEESAADAPFSPWAAALGLEEGIAVHALASLRAMMPDTLPLEPPPDPVRQLSLTALEARRFLREVRRRLNEDEPLLERIQQVFDLNVTGLGALFGVSRQAAQQWLERGVPADRQDKIAAVAAVADLLEHKLKSERIPGIARRPAEAYDGHSMLDLIAADRHQELLDITRASFDWTSPA